MSIMYYTVCEVNKMKFMNINTGIKIVDVSFMSWDVAYVTVAPRPIHALAFRVKGEALFNKETTPVISNEGSVTYMPANCGYSADYTARNEIFVIHFVTDEIFEMESYNLFSSNTVLNLFKKAYTVWNEGGPAYYHRTMAVFYEILSNISTQWDVFYKSEIYKDFFKAVDYMKKNFNDSSLTIDKLAKMANMSSTYFRKLFKERIGDSPSKHLISLRLQYADNLLASGNYTVNQVAEMSGFNDTKYFSRTVKKIYGYPPSELFKSKVKTND